MNKNEIIKVLTSQPSPPQPTLPSQESITEFKKSNDRANSANIKQKFELSLYAKVEAFSRVRNE